MPHGGPHYKIAGTSEPYDGTVVKIGQDFYTSKGGGIEGDRQRLESLTANQTTLEPESNVGNNDVVTPFVVGDRSEFGRGTYFYEEGNQVPVNTRLHHHTIIPPGRASNFMTQHVMDGNDVDVFVRENMTRTSTRTTTNQTRTQTRARTRTQTSGGGGMGGY